MECNGAKVEKCEGARVESASSRVVGGGKVKEVKEVMEVMEVRMEL